MADFKPTASQREAIELRGCPILVSAGAGSGKTRVLTERLMACITDSKAPADIDSFLIITYTRAAAGELRGRIAEELSRRLAEEPGNLRLRRQSALIRRAKIGTIHSFCADLLRENCQAAGLTPDFKVLDEERAESMRASCLERVLEDCYDKIGDDPDFRLLADTVGEGRDDSRLAALILELHGKMQCHAFPKQWAEEQTALLSAQVADLGETLWGRELMAWAKGLAEHWSAEMEALIAEMKSEPRIFDAYSGNFSIIAEQLRELSRRLDLSWDKAAELLPLAIPSLPKLLKTPDRELSERLKKRRTACLDCFKKKVAPVFAVSSEEGIADMRATAPAMRALLRLTLDFDRVYAKDKQSRGLADYSDLEHRAAELLIGEDGASTELARRLSRRYTEVMVDEYQDVSRVQDAIFTAVSDGGRRLFLVGDVKQSIYRFRLADPAIFNEKYERYAEPGSGAARILLRENFRSRREILDAANAVFSRCMSRTLGDVDYDAEAALVHGAEYYEGAVPKPELLLYELPEGDGESPDKLALEAAFTARQIRALVQSGATVTDRDGVRPMDYGDVAILLRSPNRTGGVYREALMQAGVPVGSAQGSGFFTSLEVSLVLSMLTVMDNPHKDIPLIAALRSAAFGFTPDELSYIRASKRDADFYTALEAAGETDAKCRAFLNKLAALRSEAVDLSAGETVWLVIESLDLLALCSAMDDGARRRENLMALVELSEGFEATGYRGLHRFSLWLQTLAEKGQEPNTGAGTGRAVQIVSIHRSKGLEYPVVFLCDASRRFNLRDSAGVVLVHPELGLGPWVVDLENRVRYPSLARLAIAKRQERESKSEELRLLYVALTRAKERLFVVASCKSSEKALEKAALMGALPIAPETLMGAGCFADWLLCACVADGEEHFKIRLCHEGEENLPEQAERPELPADPEAFVELRRRLAFVYPHASAVELPSKVTATELKGRYEKDGDAAELVKPGARSFRMPVLGGEERGLTPAERGVATHMALQYMDFSKAGSREGIKSEIERLCRARFLSKREAEAVNLSALERLFRSPLGKRMLAAREPLREFRFSLLLDAEALYPGAEGEQLLLQGVVDCCLEEDGELVVIDYKTDSVRTEEEIAARAEHYRGQLLAYAGALTRIFRKPVKEGVLFFLGPGKEVRVI